MTCLLDRAAQLSDRVHKAVLSSLLGAFKPIITPIGMSGWGAFTLSSTFPSLLLSFIGHQLPHWWHWGEGGGARDGEAEAVELVMMVMVVMEVMMCMQEGTGIYIGEITGGDFSA